MSAKVTLVSLCKYPIRETRPSVVPFEYILEESKSGTPTVLVIGHGRSALYLVERPDTFPVPVPVEELATDLVNGHLTSQIEYSEDAHPAFFWLDGVYTPKEVMEKQRDTVAYYLSKQNRWYMKLIKAADDNWNKNKQRRMISDKYIIAANALNIKKEWAELSLLHDNLGPGLTLIDCPFCMFKVLSS